MFVFLQRRSARCPRGQGGGRQRVQKRKKTLLTAFICGIQNLVNSLIYRTVKACCDVHRWNIYTVTICVYVQRGHRALLILGRWAYQSLVCGISGKKLGSRASFFIPVYRQRPRGNRGTKNRGSREGLWSCACGISVLL